MQEREFDESRGTTTGNTHDAAEHAYTPEVQTPDKPSQAEGERETIDESIREKEAEIGASE